MNTEHREKSMDDRLRDEIKRLTLSRKVKNVLKKRMKLIGEVERKTKEYNSLLIQMLCPKCASKTMRERAQKLAFDKSSHKRNDLVEQVLKCTVCDFIYDLPNEPKK